VRQGKVRYLGASNFAAWQLMKALGISRCHNWEAFVSFQTQYNLVTREVEREIIPLCREELLYGLLLLGDSSQGNIIGDLHLVREGLCG